MHLFLNIKNMHIFDERNSLSLPANFLTPIEKFKYQPLSSGLRHKGIDIPCEFASHYHKIKHTIFNFYIQKIFKSFTNALFNDIINPNR